MAIVIKNEEQIAKMRSSGKALAELMGILEKEIRPGITTLELDKIAEEFIKSKGARGSFKGYGGFPATICASINEEVIHGIPSARKLVNGDIISIDLGVLIDGYHADAARTFPVGIITPEDERLIKVTRDCFYEGIKFAKAGNHLNEIGAAIQDCAEKNGFSVVREFVGHGIGRQLHEAPSVANYRQPSRGVKLQKGMTLAVEPMVNSGTWKVEVLEDGWTTVTKDGKRSAHYENTLLITDGEPELFTV